MNIYIKSILIISFQTLNYTENLQYRLLSVLIENKASGSNTLALDLGIDLGPILVGLLTGEYTQNNISRN